MIIISYINIKIQSGSDGDLACFHQSEDYKGNKAGGGLQPKPTAEPSVELTATPLYRYNMVEVVVNI